MLCSEYVCNEYMIIFPYISKKENPLDSPFPTSFLLYLYYTHTNTFLLCFNCHVWKEEGSVDSEGRSTFSYKCSRIKFLTVFFLKEKKLY